MTALPHFSALMMLLAGVAAGLVDGTTAATTPTGRAISVMPRSGYSAMTPVDFAPWRSRSSPSVLRWFFSTLSATTPRPVSFTASSASARLCSGFMIAQPAAIAASSSCSWLERSKIFCAARAFATSAATASCAALE